MTSRFTILTAVGVVLLACGSPTDGCGCSPVPKPQTDLVGFVTSGNGPVTGAPVSAKIFSGHCSSDRDSLISAQLHAVADSAGRFRFEIETRRPDTLCARVVARAGSDSLVRDSIPLFVGTDDSVRVDFAFP